MKQPILEAKNLKKTFGTFTAVDDLSFRMAKGEILGLLGPNGAGKTTTIQMLLGILTPTSGSISLFGKSIRDHREEIMERTNFSSTYTHLPWRLTPYECLKYTSYFYSISDRKERIEYLIKQFDLEKLRNKELNNLSSGQLTRVNLAKAFLNEPDMLLLDEPTASLDPETAHEVRKFILDQQRKRHISVLFTSHNMAEVEEVCDRVIIINEGKIVAEDTPENLPKRIKHASIELRMVDGLKRTVKLCKQTGRTFKVTNRAIEIQLEETGIAEFLNELARKNISYDQISVNKPTLEDFFMSIARKRI